MSEKFSAEFKGCYIHIKHSPGFLISPETIEGIWDELGALCSKFGCRKILVEAGNVKREMNTMQAFESGVMASAIKPRLTVALCLHEYKRDELSEFFQTVAHNRGVNVEFFDDIEKAKKWLGVETATEISNEPSKKLM